MNWRKNLVRALRTTLQTLVGSLGAIPAAESMTDIKVQGALFLLALYAAVFAGLVALIQNIAEDLGKLEGLQG